MIIELYSGREVVPFAADLFAVPLSMWWTFNNASPLEKMMDNYSPPDTL